MTLDISVQVPRLTNLDFTLPPGATYDGEVAIEGRTDEIVIGGQTLYSFMYGEFLVGQVAALGERAEKRRITFVFDPPRMLIAPGLAGVAVGGMSADYEEVHAAHSSTIEFAGSVAWLALNSLSGTRAWIKDDGRIQLCTTSVRLDSGTVRRPRT